MKAKFISACLGLALAANVFGEGEGEIIVGNRHLLTSENELYHVPIYIDLNADGIFSEGEGIGSYAAAIGQKATLALYVSGHSAAIASATFRSDINGAFLGMPAFQTARVPGYLPGESVSLTVKVWIGDSYETAAIRGAWDFISRPLGGLTAVVDEVPIVPPGLSNWGPVDGSGYALAAPVGPVTGTDTMVRTSLGDGSVAIESLLANDADAGGAVTWVGVDAVSNRGGVVAIVDGHVVYRNARAEEDYFFYTARNNAGGVSRGRVNVVIHDAEGMIEFANRNIPMSNGEGFYNAQIYVDANGDNVFNAGEAFGSFAALFYNDSAKLGLFLKGSDTPLAVSKFHINALASLLGDPETQRVVIPGAAPGEEVELTVKAWIGGSFETSYVKGAWDFKSRPLGGITSAGAVAIPGMTGWGPQGGAGLGLSAGPLPIAGTDEIRREYGQKGEITVEELLANDVDPGGGPLTFVGISNSTHEGATLEISDSKITYHPPRVHRADYFFYTVRNARGAVATGRINVNVGEPMGEIYVRNQGMAKASGEGSYDVPIWIDIDMDGVRGPNEGIGDYAARILKPAQFSLHAQGQAEPIAVGSFSRGPLMPGEFMYPRSEEAVIPGTKPGDRAALTIKVWVGTDFDTAKVKGSWNFLSAPLGGPKNDGTTIPAPTLTGWGNEDGSGYKLEGDTNIVLPPIFIPVVIGDPIFIPIWTFRPIELTNDVIWFSNATIGGAEIVTYQTDVQIQGALFQNDSFNYTVFTTEGASVGTAELRVLESPAKMFLANRLVRRSDGGGAYNIPVWVDANFNGRRDSGEGIGSFAAKTFGADAKLGLFTGDGTTPIATARFNREALGAFLEEPEFQELTIPNASPGTQAPLLVKAWIGESYEAATIKGSWNFTSQRLGGGARTGIFETPGVTGWGNETNNAGYGIIPGAKPKTYGHVLTRLPGQNVTVKLADIFKNDSDPEGGALTLISVDEASRQGGVVTVLGDTGYYIPAIQDTRAPDYFEYTVRNAKGGIAKGRVDVVVTDESGEFHTMLAIGNTPAGVEVSFRGIVGTNYLVQFREGVEGVWQDLGPAMHEAYGLFKITDQSAGMTRFYRVLTQP